MKAVIRAKKFRSIEIRDQVIRYLKKKLIFNNKINSVQKFVLVGSAESFRLDLTYGAVAVVADDPRQRNFLNFC
jgi:hypothetical protein